MVEWDLKPGETIERKTLHGRYKGNPQRGITRSSTSPNVFIFSDPDHGSQHGYYDHWVGDVFHYAGEGQRGNQHMTGGNAAILNHVDEGRALRVFEGVGGIIRYLGEFEVDPSEPYYEEQVHDTDGQMRQVFMFRLNPLDGRHLERRHAQEPDRLGKSYVSPDRSVATHREPFEVDPAKLERSTASHMATQDALADWLVERDIEPLSPPGAPDYDIAWQLGELIYVCEVKSLTADNQARQLRLGLGQVLDYRSQLEARGQTSRAVLVTSERPADWRRWQQLCTDVRVVLAWPDFEELTELNGTDE